MYKPLKKRKMSSYSGPLQKMINDEVESRMSALKAVGDEDDKSKSQRDRFLSDPIQIDPVEAPDEYYTNELDMSKEEFERTVGSDSVDIENQRYAAQQWNKDAKEVDFDSLTSKQKEALDEYYGGDIEKRKGTKLLQKDGKFYLDQGGILTGETGVTRPFEINDPAFNQPSQTSEDNAGVERQSGSKQEPKPKVEQKFNRYGKSSSGKKDPQDVYFTVGDKTYTKQEYQQAKSSGLLKTQSNMIKTFGKPMSFRNNKH